jgi:hypothetical protein
MICRQSRDVTFVVHSLVQDANTSIPSAVWLSNRGLITCDERGVTFRWKEYRVHGRTRYKTMTLNLSPKDAPESARKFLSRSGTAIAKGTHGIDL